MATKSILSFHEAFERFLNLTFHCSLLPLSYPTETYSPCMAPCTRTSPRFHHMTELSMILCNEILICCSATMASPLFTSPPEPSSSDRMELQSNRPLSKTIIQWLQSYHLDSCVQCGVQDQSVYRWWCVLKGCANGVPRTCNLTQYRFLWISGRSVLQRDFRDLLCFRFCGDKVESHLRVWWQKNWD